MGIDKMVGQASWIRRIWTGEKVKNPVLRPEGFESTLFDYDSKETIPPFSESYHPPRGRDRDGRAFIIKYSDASKTVTERRITVFYIYEKGQHEYIMAECHEREAMRSFRVDRVLELYCGATGEELTPIDRYLVPMWVKAPVSDLGRGSPVPATLNLKPIRAALRVLMTMARCDGQIHLLEVEVIGRFINEIAPRFKMAESVKMDLARYAAYLAPNLLDFEADARLAFSIKGYFSYFLVQSGRLLVLADKKLASEEHLMIEDFMMIARECGAIKPGDSLVELKID